jgi:hypothetical protein
LSQDEFIGGYVRRRINRDILSAARQVATSRLLVAKHQHKAGGCPSLYNECLRALTTKPKKLAGY